MFVIKTVNPYLMNLVECLAYTKLKFSVSADSANLHKESLHFFMMVNKYIDYKILSS
jgi:hypothetical protein